jgi:hypothetical protein
MTPKTGYDAPHGRRAYLAPLAPSILSWLVCCGTPAALLSCSKEPESAGGACGDRVLGVGEACDGGALGGETCESRGLGPGELRCAADCKGFVTSGCGSPQPPVCGNGAVERGEACDDGYTDACGTCNATCSGPGAGSRCGDASLCPEHEACDDGNTVDDICAGDCGAWLFDCAHDEEMGPETGTRAVGPGNDLIPLCNGWVFVADATTNRIRLLNAVTGAESASYQLTAEPDRMALDRDRGLLYVSLVGVTSVARVDLVSGEVSPIGLAAAATGLPHAATASALAVGPSGRVVLSLEGEEALALLDGGTIAKVWPNHRGERARVLRRPAVRLHGERAPRSCVRRHGAHADSARERRRVLRDELGPGRLARRGRTSPCPAAAGTAPATASSTSTAPTSP